MAEDTDILSVKGKVALVTGASSGLGQHAASRLVQAGAKVIAVARREDRLQDWLAGQPEGQAAVFAWDLANLASLKDLAAQAEQVFGQVDILVNAAGLNLRQQADMVTLEGWQTTIDINLNAPFHLAQALVPGMKSRGWGRIVNFGSLQSGRAFPGGIAYGAAKGGVAQLTRAMAEAWSKDGITTNAIGPGFFPTELTAPVFNDAERSARNAAQTCIGRNGELQDMDGPLLFFCSEASAYVTGQLLYVDGGFTAK